MTYLCPNGHEGIKLPNRKPCAACYLISHRASALRSWRKKQAAKPEALNGKSWDSTKANELLMRKLK